MVLGCCIDLGIAFLIMPMSVLTAAGSVSVEQKYSPFSAHLFLARKALGSDVVLVFLILFFATLLKVLEFGNQSV